MNILTYLKRRKIKKDLRGFVKYLAHIMHVNDDILADSTKEKLQELLDEGKAQDINNEAEVSAFLRNAPSRASRILPRKTHPIIREYVDIFAVALTVAFGLRALYLQPFKIPTSSMQPTLFGIHYIADAKLPDGSRTLPDLPEPIQYALFSTQRAKADVKRAGKLDAIVEYNKYILFPWTQFYIGGVQYNLPGNFSAKTASVAAYCDMGKKLNRDLMQEDGFITNNCNLRSLPKGTDFTKYVKYMNPYTKGEQLCNGWLSLGDHLFVDRFTFQFREPKRGDITIFTTNGIPTGAKGYFYIKRLIGMPGDTLKIIDSMVYVKEKGADSFKPITSFNIPEINRIYSNKGGYHGHLAQRYLSPGFQVTVPEDHYFMLGDNSASSLDSRYWWKGVPRKNIIGRAFFIFWPFSRRWGLADRTPPLDLKTERWKGFPSMSLQ